MTISRLIRQPSTQNSDTSYRCAWTTTAYLRGWLSDKTAHRLPGPIAQYSTPAPQERVFFRLVYRTDAVPRAHIPAALSPCGPLNRRLRRSRKERQQSIRQVRLFRLHQLRRWWCQHRARCRHRLERNTAWLRDAAGRRQRAHQREARRSSIEHGFVPFDSVGRPLQRPMPSAQFQPVPRWPPRRPDPIPPSRRPRAGAWR